MTDVRLCQNQTAERGVRNTRYICKIGLVEQRACGRGEAVLNAICGSRLRRPDDRFSSICMGRIEGLIALEHAVCKDEKLPHRGGESDHFGFSGSDKAVI
jgi:hypothetical protein